MILRHGDVGQQVMLLQQKLIATGAKIEADGWFGDATEKAVVRFQKQAGLFVDGIAGEATVAALDPVYPSEIASKSLTEKDIKAAAKKLGVQVAAIKAVTEIESRESGFLPSGRPVILFERHIMYRRLLPSERAHNAVSFPGIVNRKPGGYVGGEGEWRRLRRACGIHEPTAIESASWGLFQIMGFHWRSLGYESAQKFYHKMILSEGEQLEAFVRFIKQDSHLHKALKDRDWPDFAERYNGPAYAKNQYDTRLAAAYQRHREIGRIS
ncbi:N-acetylmuramidase family protein [Marinobacter sp. 1-3A]|uniref:N-acetylmuramidase domain-containing protein n=1 Tax=Marinobacter sp. 1-3A TaxID=2582920 RepID=UPI0019086B62|nr:N-acetylmuramidase family protein [Marinobacter sp. 1-3A]MBK1874581.1 N-acetylmuramidase family protein [Marinobacter sp. 1-3A]